MHKSTVKERQKQNSIRKDKGRRGRRKQTKEWNHRSEGGRGNKRFALDRREQKKKQYNII